jgi:hypothetical protein
MGWACRWGVEETRILVGKSFETNSHFEDRRRWEGDIYMDLEEICCKNWR